MRNYYLYVSRYKTESCITTICDDKDNYRYAFNDMEKDNEPKGLGNSYDFGERIFDPRLGRFLSVDPLAAKFPSESNYIFAGNNPLVYIDEGGLKKTIFFKIIDESTGKTHTRTITKDGLVAKTYTSMYDGIKSFDWYDTKVTHTITIAPDGQMYYKSDTKLGDLRTNTWLKSEKWARTKVGERGDIGDIFGGPVKEKGGRGGWTTTTSGKKWAGNDNEYNAEGRGEIINIDQIMAAFGAAGAANGTGMPNKKIQSADDLMDLLSYGKDAINGAGAVAEEGIIPVNGGSTTKYDSCTTCNKVGTQKEMKDDNYHTELVPVESQN